MFWIHRMKMAATFAACLALLSGCGGGGGGDSAPPVASGSTATASISSVQTGALYDYDVWLPASYGQGMKTYPVIYAMDCEYRFTTLTGVLQQRSAEVILINVCAMNAPRRWTDFTMPGAAAYYRFLTRELIPSIDSKYRTDPTNRILTGHSLSGQFVLYALYMEDPANRYFTSIVSEECSCWYDANMFASKTLGLPLAMEQAMYDADHRLPVNLFMAGDTSSNESWVVPVYDLIASRHYIGLRLTHQTYFNLGHVPMDGPAFRDALNFISGP